MANQKHLAILKKGVKAWNEWREENRKTKPNLTGANLSGADLIGANLSGADLNGANLAVANLSGADLSGANLSGASLSIAVLRETKLRGADLTNSVFWLTLIADVDLSQVNGLETVKHEGPSTVGVDTIYRSQGKIPESFLRGAGVPENFITYMHSLAGQAFEYYSCFISYSNKDQDFAETLHARLQQEGVRCWYAPEDLKIGDEFRQGIDEAIRSYDKLLVVLSKNSIRSPWVKDEVEGALERERRQKKKALFPIRLDDAVIDTTQAWAASLRRARHIGDFTKWKDHDSYQDAFKRLLRDLLGAKAKSAAAK